MSLTLVTLLLVIALVAAAVVILLVPRQRRALPFEIGLWLAAWLVAALSGWLALGVVQSLAALQFLALAPVADVLLLPIVLGGFAGALVLIVPLFLMDRSSSAILESAQPDEQE